MGSGPGTDVHAPVTGGAAALAVVAAGGALGAAARYGVAVAVPSGGGVPWSTFVANATGCLLIGTLLTMLERRGGHRLLRPFAGTGVLGGYTTFSTYAVDAHGLLLDGRPVVALAYVAGTAVVAVLAVMLGGLVGDALVSRARTPGRSGGRR